MSARWLGFLFACLPCAAFAGETVAEMYPGEWVWEFNPAITRALASADVTGCGIYRYRVARASKSEFLVYCSSDNENWQAYMVWPNIDRVMGPYPPDPALP